MSELTREIKMTPAYDKRSADPNKNYGIHGVDMYWYVKGPLGAVQFVIYTGWMLDRIEREMEYRDYDPIKFSVTRPMPADLGYHSPRPHYDGQGCMSCQLLPEGKCYYDGSSLNAEIVYRILREEGSDAVWSYLENYYQQVFGTVEQPA